jgi:hypothetical protein
VHRDDGKPGWGKECQLIIEARKPQAVAPEKAKRVKPTTSSPTIPTPSPVHPLPLFFLVYPVL